MTGGIADAGALYDALVGIHTGIADESILDQYNDIRREKYQTIVDPMSTAHFERLWVKDPDTTIAEDEFLALARKMADDDYLAKQMRQVRETPLGDFQGRPHILTGLPGSNVFEV